MQPAGPAARLRCATGHQSGVSPACRPPPPPPTAHTQLPGDPAVEYREPGTEANTLGRYVVRSSFGGAAGNFVVHGSESGQVSARGERGRACCMACAAGQRCDWRCAPDAQVFVWHRDTATLLLRLEGHTATVNACAWPPACPQLLASASDDRTVRLWLAEATLATAARSSSLGQQHHHQQRPQG